MKKTQKLFYKVREVMELNNIFDLFFKGLDDVFMSLGAGGNRYQIQDLRSVELEELEQLFDEQSVMLWGKAEKSQGALSICMNTNDVRTLIGIIEGNVPEELNESVMNSLKELGDALLGGGLSSLSQSTGKGVVQFETTGIARNKEEIINILHSHFVDKLIYGSVIVEGAANFSFPWIVLLDNLLAKWFQIESQIPDRETESLLTPEEVESFRSDELSEMKTKYFNGQQGVKTVNVESADSNYRNLEVILDIQVEATARLGSVEMPLSSVLSLGPGSIINIGHEVDKPIELFVNNKLIAKGDVIIVNERFGIRITEIVSPQERIESLQ